VSVHNIGCRITWTVFKNTLGLSHHQHSCLIALTWGSGISLKTSQVSPIKTYSSIVVFLDWILHNCKIFCKEKVLCAIHFRDSPYVPYDISQDALSFKHPQKSCRKEITFPLSAVSLPSWSFPTVIFYFPVSPTSLHSPKIILSSRDIQFSYSWVWSHNNNGFLTEIYETHQMSILWQEAESPDFDRCAFIEAWWV
jgi:hypothetical protein